MAVTWDNGKGEKKKKGRAEEVVVGSWVWRLDAWVQIWAGLNGVWTRRTRKEKAGLSLKWLAL